MITNYGLPLDNVNLEIDQEPKDESGFYDIWKSNVFNVSGGVIYDNIELNDIPPIDTLYFGVHSHHLEYVLRCITPFYACMIRTDYTHGDFSKEWENPNCWEDRIKICTESDRFKLNPFFDDIYVFGKYYKSVIMVKIANRTMLSMIGRLANTHFDNTDPEWKIIPFLRYGMRLLQFSQKYIGSRLDYLELDPNLFSKRVEIWTPELITVQKQHRESCIFKGN